MTRTLKMIGCFVLLCWPALNSPAHIKAHRALVQKHAVVRDKLFLRKAMNAEEVRQLYLKSE